MGDYFPGHISIGGAVPRKLAGKLCEAIKDSGASLDYGCAPFEPENADDLLAAAKTSGTLELMDDEATYGQFEELEAFLVKHKIPFDRHSDAKYEFDAERVVFRPGMKEPQIQPATNDDDVLVRADDVMDVVKGLEAAKNGPDITGVHAQAIGVAVLQLKELCGDDVPALEPLTIK